MEMTAEGVPQQQEQEESHGWLTREQKETLISELDAFEAGGGHIEDFAKSKGLSRWSVLRYRRQISKSASKVSRQEYLDATREAYALISNGMKVEDACRKAGITTPKYYYYVAEIKPKTVVQGNAKAVRQVKEMPVVSDEKYNKSLAARIVALERLVVELNLDKQALMEAREGAI